MGVGEGMGVAVAVGFGVKVGGMGEGVVVGVDVGGAKTAVQDVRSIRTMQNVGRKIVGMGCWHMEAILPSESVLKTKIGNYHPAGLRNSTVGRLFQLG
jgi:hypothetical protein